MTKRIIEPNKQFSIRDTPTESDDNVMVSFRISRELVNRIDKRAKKNGKSRSFIIATYVEEYLRNQEELDLGFASSNLDEARTQYEAGILSDKQYYEMTKEACELLGESPITAKMIENRKKNQIQSAIKGFIESRVSEPELKALGLEANEDLIQARKEYISKLVEKYAKESKEGREKKEM